MGSHCMEVRQGSAGVEGAGCLHVGGVNVCVQVVNVWLLHMVGLQ